MQKKRRNKYNGFAIVIAWPETMCKQAGAWYDGLMNMLGISENNYYRAGHSAIVLVNSQTGYCHYFDFGRYHAPFGHGRVRDEETDHDLKIHTKATISNQGVVSNLNEILSELLNNPSCHGTGTMHASYCPVNFEKAFSTAKQMQEKSPWKYGPFIWNGTNCSRFVRTIALAGKPDWKTAIKIGFPSTISPTPKYNVLSLGSRAVLKPFSS